jgi:hypothetical protein
MHFIGLTEFLGSDGFFKDWTDFLGLAGFSGFGSNGLSVESMNGFYFIWSFIGVGRLVF